MSMTRFFSRLRENQRGNFAVELALTLPVLVVLFMVGIEFTRFLLINQKVERTAATIADLVSQSEGISEGEMANLFMATEYVMEPFQLGVEGRVIVSSISSKGGGPAKINWQRFYGGGSGGSMFGDEGETADLPDGFVVRDGESLVACEAFYVYKPTIVQDVLKPQTVHRWSVFRPRFSSLEEIES
jgi:Flp pilus assembly protein TadG